MNVYVLDFETDPFLYGRVPKPFAGCLYKSDSDHVLIWADDCAKQLADILRKMKRCRVYAHNGGKFDFHYLLPYANRSRIKIINGRVAEMTIGKAILTDSWLLVPIALDEYRKTVIDYKKFEADKRELNRPEIESYLLDDCRDLLELVTGFHKIVGQKLTIGQAAFSYLKKTGVVIPKLTEAHDARFRPFYFGGRCEVFKPGVTDVPRGTLYNLDINSAYPWAMLDSHPTGSEYVSRGTLPEFAGPWFAHVIAHNDGVLCKREKTGLTFNVEYGEFFATGWEIVAGLDTGKLRIDKVLNVLVPENEINFTDYVMKVKELRDDAKQRGDKIGNLAYKFLHNSAYGKYATDPRDWREYYIDDIGEQPREGFTHSADLDLLSLYEKPSYDGEGFFDVATAASITGKVRARLFQSMQNCKDVLYCDTDSVVCKSYNKKIDIGKELGAWKIEDTGHRMCIAGKKLYAFYGKKGTKIASKGVRLTAEEIERIAQGDTVEHFKNAPTFNIKHGARFINRKISRRF